MVVACGGRFGVSGNGREDIDFFLFLFVFRCATYGVVVSTYACGASPGAFIFFVSFFIISDS